MSYAVIQHIYNNADNLEQVLDAIQSQTIQPLGIYIVDDESTDETPDIIQSYGIPHCRLKDYLKKPYERRARAFNTAVMKARQTYPEAKHFLKVDGDTVISPDYVEKLLPHMTPNTAACSGVSTLYHKTRDLNNGAVLYRTRTLPQAKLIYGWDREIQLALIRAGYRIHVEASATYTDLRPPSVMKPSITRVIKNRLTRRTAAAEGWIRRTIQR